MKRLFPWRPQVRKGQPDKALHQLNQLQYEGIPGWILLSHNNKGDPEALFVDSQDKVKPIQIILDERMFSDTVIRVVQIRPDVFVAYDLRWLNGTCLFEKLNYKQRREKLDELIGLFHYPDFAALLTLDEVPSGTSIRGYEYYDDQPASTGVFIPVNE